MCKIAWEVGLLDYNLGGVVSFATTYEGKELRLCLHILESWQYAIRL